jgi:PAS domain S-box-containing protein
MKKKVPQDITTIFIEWESTFNTLTDPVSIHDDKFRIVKINPALAELLQEKPENILGKKCHQIIHGLDNPHENCPNEKALLNHRSVAEEFWDSRLGKWLVVTCLPIIRNEGKLPEPFM